MMAGVSVVCADRPPRLRRLQRKKALVALSPNPELKITEVEQPQKAASPNLGAYYGYAIPMLYQAHLSAYT